jgi:hypothetical protein
MTVPATWVAWLDVFDERAAIPVVGAHISYGSGKGHAVFHLGFPTPALSVCRSHNGTSNPALTRSITTIVWKR